MCVGRRVFSSSVVGREWVGGGWIFEALHYSMQSCVWLWVLALKRERVRRRIFCPSREVGSLMVLGVVVSMGEGRVTGMVRGSGSRLASFLWGGGMVGWFSVLYSSLSISCGPVRVSC